MLEKKRVLQLLFLNLNRVQIGLLLLVSFLLPMHIWIPELSLFCFLFWLLQGSWKSRLLSCSFKENRTLLFFLWGYFFYIAMSVLFFEPLNLQFSELERRWSMLIYPLIFLGTPQLMNNILKELCLFLYIC